MADTKVYLLGVLFFAFSICQGLDYEIRLTWDGKVLNKTVFIQFSINETAKNDAVEIHIKAPFYDDPPPPNGEKGTFWKKKLRQIDKTYVKS